MKRMNANCIGHILFRNFFLQQAIKGKVEGKIKVTGRHARRCKQLLDDLKEKTEDNGN
jgi:hypothetical protein